MIEKPADVPASEWEGLTSASKNFVNFVYEIFAHFDVVVKGKMKWEPINTKINHGTNNIVIAFDHQNERYVFRVPKYGIEQLRTVLSIRQKLKGKPYFVDIIYYDDKCLIEKFIPGEQFSDKTPVAAFSHLARVLSDLHTYKGTNFGPLDYGEVGRADNFESYYLLDINEQWKRVETELSLCSEAIDVLKKAWFDILKSEHGELVLCHGDIWRDNLFYDGQKVLLIDWDLCGIYHREKDVRFILSHSVSEEQRNAFLTHYAFPVDFQLLHWYNFTMQLKYSALERTDDFLDAANGFMRVMNKNNYLSLSV